MVLPEQSWTFDFGQPALTVVRNADFRIDLLYWIENTAATHDHITCGAFAAVHGDRLHGQYSFVGEQRLGRGSRPESSRRSSLRSCSKAMPDRFVPN